MKTRTSKEGRLVFFKSYGKYIDFDDRYASRFKFTFVIPDGEPRELDIRLVEYWTYRRQQHVLSVTADGRYKNLKYDHDRGIETVTYLTAGEKFIFEVPNVHSSSYNFYFNQDYFDCIADAYSKLTDSNFSEKQQSVADGLTQRLSVIKNELWYNYNYGLPLLDKGATKAMIDAKVMQIITSHPDVENIISFNSVVENRNYKATIEIQSIYGSLSVSI